jgi:ribosome-binding protein aMBF1 (putative translation factor)
MRKYLELHRAFVDVLKEAREEASIPREVLSLQIGEVKNFITQIENHKHGLSITEFVAIAEAIDRDPSKLLAKGLKKCPRPAEGLRRR